MNIDRPLDEIVKENRKARSVSRNPRRKPNKPKKQLPNTPASPNQQPQTTTPTPPSTNPADPQQSTTSPDQKNNANRRRGAIHKKRRPRRKQNPPVDVDREGNIRPVKKASFDQTKPNNHNNAISNRLAINAIASKSRSPKGVKVAVSNLHQGVTETDIAELFETVGPLKRAHLFKFNDGESACEAEVVFENMQHALEAIKRYNLVPLDNQPLQITLATDSAPVQSNNKQQRRPPQKKQIAIDNDQYDDGTPQQSPDFAQREQSPIANQTNAPAHGRRPQRRRNRRQYGRLAGPPPPSSQDRPLYED